MSCVNNKICNCKINVKTLGNDDVKNIKFSGSDYTKLNWTEVSVREILCLPELNPDIEYLNEVSVTDEVTAVELIETPYAYDSYRTYFVSSTELTLAKIQVSSITIPPTLVTSITTGLTDIVSLLEIPASTLPADNPISPILTQLTAAVTAINDAVTTITAAVAAIAPLSLPLSVCNLLSLLENVYDSLELLQDIITTVVSQVNSLVGYVATLLPSYSDPLDAIVAPLLTYITTLTNLLLVYLTSVTTLVSSLQAPNFLVLKPNAEDTCLTGREVVVEGVLHQSIMYTANEPEQPVYSVPYDIPFSAYIVVYPSFVGLSYSKNVYVVTDLTTCNIISTNGFQYTPNSTITPNLSENFSIKVYIENIFVTALDHDSIFKDVTIFISATPQL